MLMDQSSWDDTLVVVWASGTSPEGSRLTSVLVDNQKLSPGARHDRPVRPSVAPEWEGSHQQAVGKEASRRAPYYDTGWVPQSASSASPVSVIWTSPEPSALTMAISDRFPPLVARVKTILVPSGDHPG